MLCNNKKKHQRDIRKAMQVLEENILEIVPKD